MRCDICDKTLSEKEIQYDESTRKFDPCSECIEIIMDAAFSDGFTTGDDEVVTLVDGSDDYLYGDASDITDTWSFYTDE